MFDLLLVDLRSKDLHEKISKKLQVEYLSESLHTELKEVNGIIFGPNLRIIVSLPVRIKQKTKNVHFVIDTGSPKTYICEEVYESFKVILPNSSTYQILLNNKRTVVHLPPIDSNFTDINVLGTEYLKATGSNLTINFTNENERVSIYFDNDKNEITSRLGQSISQVEPNVLGRIFGIVLLVL
ncbi:361_t:CDS:2 [Funneliformis mosseae]|uniref:361_t:CDS:1 n=1 Tax=Funneliformis mosseae TaxID=27381 RepID=A0A9N8WJI3_FUNMO|nr:361_t:CDS:2 [Funneliformis mosseae]